MSSTARTAIPGKFTHGSTMRHVVVMTATGSIGLLAIFIVDALNLFYISMLGINELAAAIGFASTLMFFTVSIAIGLTVATSAVVSRALGEGDHEAAARLGGASLVFVAIATVAISAAMWPFLQALLELLGARGETLELATRFLQIVIPSSPIASLGMCTTGILRGVGDARRAMYVTLAGGIAAAFLDPLFIFGFGLGLDGAAISTFLSRLALLSVGIYGAHRVHRLIRLPDLAALSAALRPFFAVGLPAMMTQIATPIGNAYVTVQIASFGDQAVAGWAIIGRVLPVAFSAVFALSGSVGPIIGQNIGARRYDRAAEALRNAMLFILVYVFAVWMLLALFSSQIASLFSATGEAGVLIVFFCHFVAASFFFNGALFVSNSAFNNIGYAAYSTLFSWGRSTLGVIPFVWVGAHFYGAKGIIAGWGFGAVIFGVAAAIMAFRVVARMADRETEPDDMMPAPPPAANSPFSTSKAATLQ